MIVSAKWIAVAWLEVFRGKPNIKIAEIKEGIKKLISSRHFLG